MELLLIGGFWAFVGWVCWRWFLRNWVMSLPVAKAIQGRFFARKISDEAYYAQAAYEVRNNVISDGLWTKAWSDAQGDDVKAQAFYIRYRVEDLRRQAAGKFSEFSKDFNGNPGKTIISCPQCGAKLRVAAGKHLDVHCPKCNTSFRTMTALPSLKSSYGANFARYIYALGACIGIFLVGALLLGLSENFLRNSTFDTAQRIFIKAGILFGMVWSCVSAWKAIVKSSDS